MKKSVLIALCFVSLSLQFCKKGEDDPALSLRSRQSRLVGDWRLVSGQVKITNATNDNRYTSESELGSESINLKVSGDTSYTFNTVYFLTLLIEKDGKFEFNETLGSRTLNAKGEWFFNSGAGEAKAKDAVTFLLKSVSHGSSRGYHFFNQSSTAFSYKLKELRNKKMVLTATAPIHVNAAGEKQTFESIIVLEQE